MKISFQTGFLRKVGTITSCIPEFWLSLVLILIFSVNLKLLPGSGAYDLGQSANPLSRLTHLILPLTVVVLSHLWYYAYLIRNRLLEETRKDYVLLAKAKGMSRKTSIVLSLCEKYYAIVHQSDGNFTSACDRRDVYRGNGIFLSGNRNAFF